MDTSELSATRRRNSRTAKSGSTRRGALPARATVSARRWPQTSYRWEELQRLMERKSHTPATLAQEIGCHNVVVYSWLHGRKEPRKENVAKLAAALGTTAANLRKSFPISQ